MDVHLRSAFHCLLGRVRIGASRVRPLSPELHTADYSFACPGSSTWVDKVPSRDTPSLNLAGHRGDVAPGAPQVARSRSSSRRQRPSRVQRANSPESVLKGMSQSWPIARHCIPQKQTHQIAITALRSAARASGGLGPKRVGRLPAFAMALSSASTSSTKASTSANASHGPGDVFAGRTAVPILYGLDAIDDGLRDGLSSFLASPSIQPQVAATATTVGMSSLQTDTDAQGPDLGHERNLQPGL